MQKKMGEERMPEVRVAVVYFKEKKNQTKRRPDYYYRIINDWIVFPHELEGLTREEIRRKSKIIEKLVFD
jgi:hypothetical protein